MKVLLRSCFVANPGKDSTEGFLHNYLALSGSGLGFTIIQDQVIWNYIIGFVGQHNHVPTISTLRSYFEHRQEMEVVDRLEALAGVAPKVRGDFLTYLEQKSLDYKARLVAETLTQASTILTVGHEEKLARGETVQRRGPYDAIRYVLDRSQEIVTPTTGVRLEGNIVSDTATVLERYERNKIASRVGIFKNTGIEQIDKPLGGVKRGDLWTHAAFTGHLKSTFALNWAYTQAFFHGNNVLYWSIEMPYVQCQNNLIAMHSFHEKFRDVRVKLGIQENENPVLDTGLEYRKIRDALLNDVEEQFFRIVLADLEDPTNEYAQMLQICVADPDKSDFTVADLKSRSELYHSRNSVGMLVVDHVGLMAPRKWVANTTERLNEIVRDLKRTSMNFNRGQGVGIVALSQINRDGLKAAEKNGGFYNLTNLAYANEIERSSDVVTATWMDDKLRFYNPSKTYGRVQFQCLKARDDQPFEPFRALINWPSKRMVSMDDRDAFFDLDEGKRNRVVQEADEMGADEVNDLMNRMDG